MAKKTTKPANNPEQEINNLIAGYEESPQFDQGEQASDVSETPITIGEPKKRKYTKRKKLGQSDQEGQPGQPVQLSGDVVLSGALLLMLIDIGLPNIICLINNKMSKKKIKPESLQMTREQRNQLSPIADQVTQYMLLKGNPVTILIISLIGIYGLNLLQEKV